jgi:trans-2-enoyl-CoA reductase
MFKKILHRIPEKCIRGINALFRAKLVEISPKNSNKQFAFEKKHRMRDDDFNHGTDNRTQWRKTI